MKKIGIIIFIAALVIGLIVANFFSFGRVKERVFNISFDHSVTGSGSVASEQRDVAGFTGIDVGGAFVVEITAQKEYSVVVEADDNLLPLITTTISGGTLEISSEKKLSTKNPIRIRISAPDIEKIESSGAAKVSIADLKGDSLDLESSGAAWVKVVGEVASLNVDVSGASNVDAESLKAENATVDASGASFVGVNVWGDLKSDASGASRIVYSGDPKNVEKRTSGASSTTVK